MLLKVINLESKPVVLLPNPVIDGKKAIKGTDKVLIAYEEKGEIKSGVVAVDKLDADLPDEFLAAYGYVDSDLITKAISNIAVSALGKGRTITIEEL